MTLRFKTVLFDLDGTLVDSLPILKNIFFEFSERLGAKKSNEDFDFLNGKTLNEIISYLKIKYSVGASEEEMLLEYKMDFEMKYLTKVTPQNGAADTLSQLSGLGVELGLVTSAPKQLIESYLQKNNWSHFFAHKITAEDFKSGKPDPEPFLKALEKFKTERSRCLAVEDSKNGVLSARAAGLKTLWYRGDSADTYFINDLKNVLGYVYG